MVVSNGVDDLTADSPELGEINIAWPCFPLRHQELLSSSPMMGL
jgi:hypothetical protein